MINLNDSKSDFGEKVHRLALELKNPRLEGEELERVEALSGFILARDRKRRMLLGGPLTFMEAKILVREQLTFDHWKIRFYEVIQFPQVRFFESEKEARNYWKRIKMRKTIYAQKAYLEKPGEHLFAERPVDEVYHAESYEPDPLGAIF